MFNLPRTEHHRSPDMLWFEDEGFLHPTQTLYHINERRHTFSKVFDHKENKTVYIFHLLLLCALLHVAWLNQTTFKRVNKK